MLGAVEAAGYAKARKKAASGEGSPPLLIFRSLIYTIP